MGDELDRAEALGLLGVVLHPGAYTVGSEADGLTLIADALLDLLRARRRGKTMVLLEHTAGQGTALGATFEQLASIIAKMNDHRRVGVCLDTCHLLASGYDICSPEGYASTFTQFGRLVGFDRLQAFHLNDSKKPLGSRVDRHEHIGQGYLGLEPFRRIVNDRRFRDLPMLLETPKAEGKATGPIAIDPLDEQNLNTLRGLMANASGRQAEGGERASRSDPARPAHLPSPNTSASNRHIFGAAAATRRAAGRPCGRSGRETSSASQCHSVATCGSSRPRCQPGSTTRPWRPTTMSCGPAIGSSGPSSEISMSIASSSSGATGGNRGSAAAGGDRAARHDVAERLGRLDVADAAAELAALVKGDECAAGTRENCRRRIADAPDCGSPIDVRGDRLARDAQQQLAIVFAGHRSDR